MEHFDTVRGDLDADVHSVSRSRSTAGVGVPAPPGQASGPFLLAMVIPTRNEVDALPTLLPRLLGALDGIAAEVIFVDDSDDATPLRITEIASRPGLAVPIRLVHREKDQRAGGLSTAVIEGFRASRAAWICVMDADLQHPPEAISALFAAARRQDADVVVASRYCDDGASDLSFGRHAVSWVSTRIAGALFPVRLRSVSDPMSGFFIVRRSALATNGLRPDGFKILMEILVRSPGLCVVEVPFSMAERKVGKSKGSLSEGARFAKHLVRLRMATVVRRNTRMRPRSVTHG